MQDRSSRNQAERPNGDDGADLSGSRNGGRAETDPIRAAAAGIAAPNGDDGALREGVFEAPGPRLDRAKQGERTRPRRTRQRLRPDAAAENRGERRRRLRGEELTYCSDTMLGIDKLYSLRAKGHNI
jgi:hypothetical protein